MFLVVFVQLDHHLRQAAVRPPHPSPLNHLKIYLPTNCLSLCVSYSEDLADIDKVAVRALEHVEHALLQAGVVFDRPGNIYMESQMLYNFSMHFYEFINYRYDIG